MGIDLTISPESYPGVDMLAYQRLAFDRDYTIWDSITALKPKLLKAPVRCYDDEGIVETTTDPYGDPLT